MREFSGIAQWQGAQGFTESKASVSLHSSPRSGPMSLPSNNPKKVVTLNFHCTLDADITHIEADSRNPQIYERSRVSPPQTEKQRRQHSRQL